MAWYKEWFGTRYYKLLYGHRDEHEAHEWVLSIAERTGLKAGARVLDMGCGRGRHALSFTQLGAMVTGIDISRESIAEARVLVPEADLRVHDMRVPIGTSLFDLVVCLFTSLGYSGVRRDDQLAVNAAAQALKPGGLFVLDLFNGVQAGLTLVKEECQTEKGIRFMINRDLEQGDIVKRISVEDNGCTHTFVERVHAWSAEEVKELVQGAGLVIQAITDGPQGGTFDARTSERIVVWAMKPTADTRAHSLHDPA